MSYTISAPPHLKSRVNFRSINIAKIGVLVPVCLAAIYFFGLPALEIIIATVLAAVATEFCIQKAFKQEVTIKDGHAAMLGLMFALLTPPTAPVWVPVCSVVFGIGVGKHAFGGIGSYIFNPVIASWIFAKSSWGAHMVSGSIPHMGQISDLVIENGAGFLVDVSPILILLGAAYLLYKQYIEWRIPLAFGLTVLLFNQTIAFFTEVSGLIQDGVMNPLMYMAATFIFLRLPAELPYIMTGVLIFGIFFLATDTPTSPVTKNGRIVYGIVCGLLVSVYGYFGNYVDGTLYGIFLANALSAFIEANTLPSIRQKESMIGRSCRKIMAFIPSSLKFEVIKDE